MKILLLILALVIITGCSSNFKTICVNDKCFNAEIADDAEERRVGLMKYDMLQEDEAMWFVFQESSRHSFWMKDMRFPIDIIWVDDKYNIVNVERNVQPCVGECTVYTPEKEARYVLEVRANSNINIEDKITVR